MPDVRLPNGVIVRNVPEGTTKEQLMQKVIAKGLATEQDFNLTHDFSAKEMIKNLPGSIASEVGQIYESIAHPIDTGTNIRDVLSALLGKIPGVEATDVQDAKLDALADHYKSKYTNWENFKKHLETDPAAVMSDIAAVGSIATLPLKGTKVGNIANKAMQGIDPVNMTVNAAKAPYRAIGSSKAPTRMQQNAMNIDDPDVAQFSLDQGYMPTDKSLARFEADRAAAQNDYNAALDNNPLIKGGMNQVRSLKGRLESLATSGKLTNKQRLDITKRIQKTQDTIDQLKLADPALQLAESNLNNLQKLSDSFKPATARANKISGNLALNTGMPLGAGMGITYPFVAAGALPGSAALPAAAALSVGLGYTALPKGTSRLANALNRAPGAMAGFGANSMPITMLQEIIRGAGGDETRDLLVDLEP